MRGFSSAASITLHCFLGAALLFGTAKTVHPNPRPIVPIAITPPPPERSGHGGRWAPPSPLTVSIRVDEIPLPRIEVAGSATRPTIAPSSTSTASAPGTESVFAGLALGGENAPEILSGPLPSYPEPLRQAGVAGRVVLEAIVDTAGRVRRDSIVVVSGTNPEFVAAARRALLATLFRPAFVAGRAVRMRIRIPFEFTIRNGRGEPR